LCGFLTRKLIENPKSVFKEVLDDGIAEYGSSFSPPLYKERLKRHSQELLNEYTHHIISQAKEPGDCEAYLDREVSKLEIDASVAAKLKNLLATVLDKEERGPRLGRKQI
jgi:hypothetical protein